MSAERTCRYCWHGTANPDGVCGPCAQTHRPATAGLIRAEIRPCPDHPMPLPKPSCWTCGRNGAFERAARIAEAAGGAS